MAVYGNTTVAPGKPVKLVVYEVHMENEGLLKVVSVVDMDKGIARIVAAELGGVVGYDPYPYTAEGLQLVDWIDEEQLILLTSVIKPGAEEPSQRDLAVELAGLSGKRQVVAAFSHYLEGYEVERAWVPPGAYVMFLHRYMAHAGGEILRVDLSTGASKLIKTAIPVTSWEDARP